MSNRQKYLAPRPGVMPAGKLFKSRKKLKDRDPVVEVVWFDAVSVGAVDWEDEHSVDILPALSFVVGYVIADTDEALTVVSLVNEDSYAHGICIPKGMVYEVRELS